MRSTLWLAFSVCNFGFPNGQSARTQLTSTPSQLDLLITHGELIDGSGSAAQKADLGLKGDRIVFIGDSARRAHCKRVLRADRRHRSGKLGRESRVSFNFGLDCFGNCCEHLWAKLDVPRLCEAETTGFDYATIKYSQP